MGAVRATRIAKLFAAVGLVLNPACQGSEGELFSFEDGAVGGAGSGDGDSETRGTGGLPDSPSELKWQRPQAQSSIQIQLFGELDLAVEAEFQVVDLHSPQDFQFMTLNDRGVYISCYFSAGSYEPFRPDADAFPERVLGEALADYPDERWLDVTDPIVLELMIARMERARARGCDAVYPSAVRPAESGSGFQLDAVEYAVYAKALADAAHDLELGVVYAGGEQASSEALDYDATLVFGCVQAGTCDSWKSVEQNGTAIFLVELGARDSASEICALRPASSWPFIIKEPNLSAYRFICP